MQNFDNSSGNFGNNTNYYYYYYYNVPEFLLKSQKDYIGLLKEENERLKTENRKLQEENKLLKSRQK